MSATWQNHGKRVTMLQADSATWMAVIKDLPGEVAICNMPPPLLVNRAMAPRSPPNPTLCRLLQGPAKYLAAPEQEEEDVRTCQHNVVSDQEVRHAAYLYFRQTANLLPPEA